MISRAVEIAGTGRHLHKERGFLVVSHEKEELGRIPLDNVEFVLFSGHGLTCTSELLLALAKDCIPLVLCDHRCVPASVLWPVESHHLQAGRIRAQAAMSAPLRKQLWRQLVRAKVCAQAESLRLCGLEPSPRLERLAAQVRSGDTGNVEGQAARIYWPLLFGPEFRRDPDLEGVNLLLNYGYTVLRAATVRAIMKAGLHPAFALHHHSVLDTMPLADDLMEPFRPLIDMTAHSLTRHATGEPTLDAKNKERLVAVTSVDMVFEGEVSPLPECLLRLARSLVEACQGERRTLMVPDGLHITAGQKTAGDGGA